MKDLKKIRNQRGQGMTEYILVVALIAVAVIGAVKFFGSQTGSSFRQTAATITGEVDKANSDGPASRK